MTSIIGICAYNKPFPKVVHEVFNNVEKNEINSVLDIGCGDGRFIQFFLNKFNIKEYFAIEPDHKVIERLRRNINTSNYDNLYIIQALWEDVRDSFLRRKYDIVILWDVLMFMDLTKVYHNDTILNSALKELDVLINITNKYFLFSLHPVKRCTIHYTEFKKIFEYLDNHEKLELLGKRYLNRVYKIK